MSRIGFTTLLVAVALSSWSGFSVATIDGAQAQKGPESTGTNLNSSKSNVARPACEARCRDLHSGDPAALEACKRDCGAVGPAAPGLAVSDPGAP